MRKAILMKFVQVLLGALCLNSFMVYIAGSSILLKNARRDMLYTLETIDSILDYHGDLSGQICRLEEMIGRNKSRLTLIFQDGTVAADTGADREKMENHLEREEVAAAISEGSGYATRFSDTLNQTMLYVALRSAHRGMILRLGVPFSGIREYLPMLLPAVWLSFAVAVLASLGITDRLVVSVAKPILDLSGEMMRVQGGSIDLHFEPGPYPEINAIGSTAVEMSKRIQNYVCQLERERGIRQEFFSNASHELKTPITSIQGYAELLEHRMVTDPAVEKDFIGRIKKEAVHMADLINDILMISRLESREAEVTVTKISLLPFLNEICDSLEPLARKLGVFLSVECPPILINANARHLQELFTNLISNGVNYNRPGGQVQITAAYDDSYFSFRVKDNGTGIPKESIERIFERFYRVDKGRSRKQGGTGLGLSIVKHIVNFYGGRIQVESEIGKGSEFIVVLPAEKTGEKEVSLTSLL